MVPYQKRLLVPLIQSSVIYLGKEIEPINNGQMLRATLLTVWANELHSSLLSGNTLGLGNTALSSRLWGESTSVATCRLVLAHQTVSHLKVWSLPQGFREDISLAWRPLLGVMARNQRLWNKEFVWNYSHVILLWWGYFSEIFEYVFSSLISLCYILHNWRTYNNNKKKHVSHFPS